MQVIVDVVEVQVWFGVFGGVGNLCEVWDVVLICLWVSVVDECKLVIE